MSTPTPDNLGWEGNDVSDRPRMKDFASSDNAIPTVSYSEMED